MVLKRKILNYLNSDKLYPTVIALASGLYPLLYCYSRNFSIVNSLAHLIFFVLSFLIIPIVVFNAVYWLLKKLNKKKYSLLVMALLNVFTFLFLIKTITYSGAQRKKTVVIIVIAVLFAMLLKKQLKRLVLLQWLLAIIGFTTLIPIIYTNLSIDSTWQHQPDDIVNVQFKKKPNVYVIQPDGYTNFSELDKGYYTYDNSIFETFLANNNFTNYPNFRSNYSTTLSSNSSFFMMKHHYYNKRISDFELYNARDMIVSSNPVLDVFKNNGYKTHFITETGYMLFNRPKRGYDYCNFNYNDFPFISPGISEPIDISSELKQAVLEETQQPKFFFVQLLKPWHIKSKKANSSNDKDIEKAEWLSNLQDSNTTLSKTITMIKAQDANALIVIMADHGGYVGFNYASEADAMTQDRDLVHSIYSSQLSILWPDENSPSFNNKFKTPVNLFRLLFTYLSEDARYLNHLQDDISYKVLRENVSEGIYQYIDQKGEVNLKALK